jgi:hypothetical protein
MAKTIETLDDFMEILSALYNASSTEPESGEEDYSVWTYLANIAVNIWENEEGILWNELFVKLADASTGDKTTSAGDYSYAVPTDFRFPASGIVWLGSGTSKTAVKVIKQEEVQLNDNNSDRWCYFLLDGSPTLEFNPNLTITGGETISYNYYKNASKLTTGSSTFEMSDPMFAVYYALAELKKEEGNSGELQITSQKLDAMKSRNDMSAWFQQDQLINKQTSGFGW